jgi:hypothetical protein
MPPLDDMDPPTSDISLSDFHSLFPDGESSLLAFKKANPPFYAIFHLFYLCSCGKHLTPGPKTSIRITTTTGAEENAETLIIRFRVPDCAKLKFGDRVTGPVVPDYGGLKGKKGPVKVVLDTGKSEILCEKARVKGKEQEINIWVDEGEREEHTPPRESLFEEREARRTSTMAALQEVDLREGAPLDGGDAGSEDVEYEEVNEGNLEEEEEQEDDEEERVWTSPPEHPLPAPTPTQLPPASRLPSNEEWERASKRMRMMR